MIAAARKMNGGKKGSRERKEIKKKGSPPPLFCFVPLVLDVYLRVCSPN